MEEVKKEGIKAEHDCCSHEAKDSCCSHDDNNSCCSSGKSKCCCSHRGVVRILIKIVLIIIIFSCGVSLGARMSRRAEGGYNNNFGGRNMMRRSYNPVTPDNNNVATPNISTPTPSVPATSTK